MNNMNRLMLIRSAAALLLATVAPVTTRAQDSTAPQGHWTAISDDVLAKIAAEGKKPTWPGVTAGVSVDRTTGEVRMVVPDQGLWLSVDQGKTFARIESSPVSGRCETGFALNADPMHNRLACFMLDGKSAITLDGGKTWTAFQQVGRGWDFGAVDWSQAVPKTLLAIHHEADGELLLSQDGGASWKVLGKGYTAVGLFGSRVLLAAKPDGLYRSADEGATWTRVSDQTPSGHVLTIFKGVGYWVTARGLLVSRDQGRTWQPQGAPIAAGWGPYFGRDEKQIVVVGRLGNDAGFLQTEDAGKTWRLVAPVPSYSHLDPADRNSTEQWVSGWFYNFGWDPAHNLFYTSRMSEPTVRYR